MNNFQELTINIKFIKAAAIGIIVLLLSLFPSFNSSINRSIENSFRVLTPSGEVDTGIVIISISENDIKSLGGWPLKRSYYALVINNLSKYLPDKIGIEVFLSNNVSMPAMYNSLMLNEMKKAGNVVLASLAGEIKYHEGRYYSDKIELPLQLKDGESIKTGFINYLDDGSLIIPLFIEAEGKQYNSFSIMLSSVEENNEQTLALNINHSWKEYNSIGIVEFLKMCEEPDTTLAKLKNKTVIIGVTDPTIARTFKTYYDDQLPGIALHAFAVENINMNKGLNQQFLILSAIVFTIIILLLEFFAGKKVIVIILSLPVFYLTSLFIFTMLNVQLSYSFYLLPAVISVIIQLSTVYREKGKLLQESINDLQILDSALKAKEDILKRLEKELNISGKSESILQKINSLKEDIAQINKSKLDEEFSEVKNPGEVKEFFGLIYKSSLMQDVVGTIEKVAPQDATVLILGESGSGKELIANAVHQLSKRKNNKFVAVNCAALTTSLLESELFGHVKGAFTNAVADKKGMFEAADKGTIFLDEIGETDENFQVKLLRVLQSGEIQKVGSSEVKHVDVRIVAATNKDLKSLVEEKKFREDLYYRLNVISIALPSLRERKDDIPILAEYFAEKNDAGLKLSKAVIDQLMKNEWKGNVRELESVIKRASIFAETENRTIIKLGDLPDELSKVDKSDLESLILESLRQKGFSHSSINETGKELGNLSRTIISENFRGIFLKQYFLAEYDFDKTISILADTNNEKIISKVRSKGETYLNNIRKDLIKLPASDFEVIKRKFNSKYKNLPQKYHHYLDEVIKKITTEMHGK